MIEFTAKIVVEGAKRRGDRRNRRITIPAAVAAELETQGCTFPSWLRARIESAVAFVYARRTASRKSVDIALPSWRLGKLAVGSSVVVRVDTAQPFRAQSIKSDLDWLPHLDHIAGDYFPADEGDELALWGRYSEPFTLRRTPIDEESYWWLLGFYQAEGSKGGTANDFHVANTNPRLLDRMIAALATWNIDRTRLYMGVLHRIGTLPDPAVNLFAPLGVEITHVTAKPKNDATGVLHVYRSMVLMRLVRERLRDVFAHGFPSAKAARWYTLGWLDGDGSILHRRSPGALARSGGSYELVLAGHAEEHRVVKVALSQAFGWQFERGSYHKNTDEGTQITLRMHEMLDLLDAGAFGVSMNLARLLLAFDERTKNLREIVAGQRPSAGAFVRWGLLQRGGTPTALAKRVCAGHKRWEQKIERARQLKATAPELFGVKCAALPAEF